jgi:hypothetical protein
MERTHILSAACLLLMWALGWALQKIATLKRENDQLRALTGNSPLAPARPERRSAVS